MSILKSAEAMIINSIQICPDAVVANLWQYTVITTTKFKLNTVISNAGAWTRDGIIEIIGSFK